MNPSHECMSSKCVILPCMFSVQGPIGLNQEDHSYYDSSYEQIECTPH